MNNHVKFAFFLIVYWIGIIAVLAQESTKEYHFKKGEVLDILLLTNGANAKALFPRYLKTVFPVGEKYSFSPVPGFAIVQTLQGGVHPKSLILGKWESLEKREQFLDVIVSEIADFHEQRRAIWDYFALTYYEMDKDFTFRIDKSKYIVVTSFWKNEKDFKEFIDDFEQAQKQGGGKEVLTLTNGISPAGYAYQADYLNITAWESKSAFESFTKTHQYFNEKRISNVHQFALK